MNTLEIKKKSFRHGNIKGEIVNYIEIKEQLIALVTKTINEEFNQADVTVELEQPADFKNGHFSTNAALKNSKVIGDNPRNIATKLVEGLQNSELLDHVEIAGPGFINFYLNDAAFKGMIKSIQANETFGATKTSTPEKINIEFVSANPTGDLHLGHARNATYGDALARTLKAVGHDVTKEYYINDAGAQMMNLGKSIYFFYEELCNRTPEFPEDGYRGAEIKEVAENIFKEFGDSKLDADMDWFVEVGYKRNLDEIKRVLGELNIEFDVWSSEKSYHESGKVAASLGILDKTGDLYEEDGAKWLNTEKYGDDKNRVIEKSDGSHTYFTSDIAYHIDKYERGFERLIDVWGGDHHGYIKRVEAAIESLGHDPKGLEITLIQMVSIVNNGEVVKMSKRAGTSVTIKDLLKELDSDVLRYFFIMRSPDTQLDFDIAVAQKESSENPVYYVQYAHARIASILAKAKAEGININSEIGEMSEIEKEITLLLARFEQTVIEAANKRLPHIIANYLYDVATLYHRYYNMEKVFVEDENKVSDKLNLAIAVKRVLNNGLDLLGIQAKEQM